MTEICETTCQQKIQYGCISIFYTFIFSNFICYIIFYCKHRNYIIIIIISELLLFRFMFGLKLEWKQIYFFFFFYYSKV